MRLHFSLSPNTQTVPFSYAQPLASVWNRWLGPDNPHHNALSLYSLSWIQSPTRRNRPDGFDFPNGATWFASAPDTEAGQNLLNAIAQAATQRPQFAFGMEVVEIYCQPTPEFGPRRVFRAASPIFIRGPQDGDRDPHILWDDPRADALMTATLRHKLDKAGLSHLSESAHIAFDRTYPSPKSKLVKIHQDEGKPAFQKRATFCPVIVEGGEEVVKFAFNTGAGNLTGMGFGSLI